MIIKYNNYLIGFKYFPEKDYSYLLISILKPIEPTLIKGQYSNHFYKHLIYCEDNRKSIYFNWKGNTFGISFTYNREYHHFYQINRSHTYKYNICYNIKKSKEYHNLFFKIIDFLKEVNYE